MVFEEEDWDEWEEDDEEEEDWQALRFSKINPEWEVSQIPKKGKKKSQEE